MGSGIISSRYTFVTGMTHRSVFLSKSQQLVGTHNYYTYMYFTLSLQAVDKFLIRSVDRSLYLYVCILLLLLQNEVCIVILLILMCILLHAHKVDAYMKVSAFPVCIFISLKVL